MFVFVNEMLRRSRGYSGLPRMTTHCPGIGGSPTLRETQGVHPDGNAFRTSIAQCHDDRTSRKDERFVYVLLQYLPSPCPN